MYVLGFVGSPRHEGNTDILMERVLQGAGDTGAATKKVYLADLDIKPCQACDTCKTGACQHQDDMAFLREEMEKADVYVIGTPIYFWGPSAQLKAFVDRWYAYVQTDDGNIMKGKTAALICAFGDEDSATARHTVGMFQDAFDYLGVGFDEILLVSAHEKGEVAKDDEALTSAYDLGKRLYPR